MKVLFAVSNEEISESIIKKYQKEYKQIISYKNVYYFNAILKELQKDKSYDRVVISEDLEAFTQKQYDQIDKFIFEKLDDISDEASNIKGNDIPIIVICSDRRNKSEQMLVKLFGIGIYNAIIGKDRSVDEVCRLINRPRSKKEAKIYYQIESDDVKYQGETENDVSEVEIQNILAHYKRLGKNEGRYIDSFNNIAAQYNDTQLRIISKFLPLNVRAVLEEKSPKYQQVMSFHSSVTENLRVPKKQEGPSEKLLNINTKENVTSQPVVIPTSVNMKSIKKLSRKKMPVQDNIKIQEEEKNTKQENITPIYKQEIKDEFNIVSDFESNIQQKSNIDLKDEINVLDFENKPNDTLNGELNDIKFPSEPNNVLDTKQNETDFMFEDILDEKDKNQEEIKSVKRGRGRPRKIIDPKEQNEETKTVKRGRGRPRKNPLPQEDENKEEILPGVSYNNEENILPGFQKDNEEEILPGLSQNDEENILPGFQEDNEEEILPELSQNDDENILPGFQDDNEEEILPGLSQKIEENILPRFSQDNNEKYNNSEYYKSENKNNYYEADENISTIDLSYLLTSGKKIVTFVGTSKNGTSFIVNNLAELISSTGVNTAILDTTQNRNSYYIYTKNEESLRKVATQCIDSLKNGIANGIQVNKNLTVYTSLPNEGESINDVDKILESLLKKHNLILIDTDFETPVNYFKQSQETYLVQTLDVLTIQPLTAFLRSLKSRNILEEKKLRIVLNKAVKIRGVNDKTIIGGMAYYNDPAMSFMTELFDRNMIKYISIPFEEETYIKYLEGIIECNVSLKGYSKGFLQALKSLSNMVYPASGTYTPPTASNYGTNSTFSANINNTLDQMKKKY